MDPTHLEGPKILKQHTLDKQNDLDFLDQIKDHSHNFEKALSPKTGCLGPPLDSKPQEEGES
jgi:hypothetical protein